MIVKNEEENLPECLESVKGLVDEVVLVDTGSVDRTVGIAESFGARVFHLPWPGDFSAARNESLDHATGKWILYLDADERLDGNGREDCLRKAASDPLVDAWSIPIRNFKYGSDAFDTTSNIRLFRNLPGIRFENEVHERVEPALTRMGAKIALAPFYINHLGYRLKPELMKEKLRRNLALSRKHLERTPDDPYCLYYLGASYLQLDQPAESRCYFERVLASKNLPLPLRAMACNLLAYLCLQQKDPDNALDLAEKSAALAPRQNTARLLLGLAKFQKKDFGAALPLLRGALDFLRLPPDNRQTSLSQEYAFVDEAELHKLIGICCSELGRIGEALTHLRKSIELGSRDPEVFRRAGVCCVNTGDYRSGLSLLEEAEKLGAARTELMLPMAFASLRLRDFARAEALLAEAEALPSPDAGMISRIRDCLDAERPKPSVTSRPSDSHPLHAAEQAADLAPVPPDTASAVTEAELPGGRNEPSENSDDASARYHLGMTCMVLGREAEAAEAFDRALSGAGLVPELEAEILNRKSYLHLKAGEFDAGLLAASRSLAVIDAQNTARLFTGLALFHKHAFGTALPWLLEAYRFLSRPPQERVSGISREETIDQGDLIEMIGICLAETGNFSDAIPFLKLTAKRKPDAAIFERLGVCLLNIGESSEALQFLKRARTLAADPNALSLPISFACFRTGDYFRAAQYFRNAAPKSESDISVAFQLLRTMAAEKNFKPYLQECVHGKLELFRRAFPPELEEFLSELAVSGLIFETSTQHAEA